MKINRIIEEASELAYRYDLKLVEIDNPDEHIFVEGRKSIQAFVQESMKFLEEKDIL